MKLEITSKKILKKIITLITTVILLIVFWSLNLLKIVIIDQTYVLIAIIFSVIVASVAIVYKYREVKSSFKYYHYQILDFLVMLNFALLFVQIFFMVAYFPATVYKSSMFPNLKEGDHLLVLSTENVKHQDIIVLKVDKDINTLYGGVVDEELIVKRVIAVGGDTFYYQNGYLFLNDKLVDEYYLKDDSGNFHGEGLVYNTYTNDFKLSDYIDECSPTEVCKIPQDYYFVLGDNRRSSIDSRSLGLFHKSQIVGIAKYKQLGLFKWVKI